MFDGTNDKAVYLDVTSLFEQNLQKQFHACVKAITTKAWSALYLLFVKNVT